ncbi:hypothetical protein DH2020_001225 [Rehmannia glutinosa]|uniref:CCHC-type domain-containing protein n=1 Tax=Rehmannia glutinosa TaxID=99300 RepID=A0ABR0XYR7_REHGL
MDHEEICKRIENIKLSQKKNNPTITLDQGLRRKGEERLSNCLVAKVLSSKLINRDAFRQHLPRILRATKKIEIEVVGENLFVLEFNNPMDRRRVIERGGPWHFFRNLILFQEFNGVQSPDTLDFTKWEVWVQCHNVPIAYMQEEIIRKIGNQIGQVIEIDKGELEVFFGRFIRMKVKVEVDKPLQGHIVIQEETSQEESIVLLTYEKFPDFCYVCGKVGHTWRECEESDKKGENMEYGKRHAGKFTNGTKQISEKRRRRAT